VTDETRDDRAEVLVVEDETELADLYAEYLQDSHDVDVAYSGQDALEMVGAGYDVVLLDRRMPVVSGNEVLAHIEEESLDCRIAMVTAVNPDFEIIDLRIDDYLIKPVTRSEVRTTVERLLALDEYNQRLQELTTKKLKRNVLEVEKSRRALQGSEQFERLNEDIENLQREVESIADDLEVENADRRL